MRLARGLLICSVWALAWACQSGASDQEPGSQLLPAQVAETQRSADSAGIHQMLDRWHQAASEADSGYFEYFAPHAVYIGTDVSERWTATEFRNWSRPFFKRGQAWSFTPLERRLRFSADASVAWFDEVLDTWMGPCRATGVLTLQGDSWLIEHYQLSTTVPNDSIGKFRSAIWGLGE